MTPQEKENLIQLFVTKAHSAEKLHSRFSRIVREPWKAIPFFIMQIIARIKPFVVSYKTFWGDKVKFYLPEGNAVYYYGFYEADLTNFFIRSIKDGDVFFDIGTHIGFYTLLASNLVGEGGQVHGFEPTPRTFNTLKENTASKKNIFINNVAVMEKESEIDFVDYGPKYSAFNTYNTRSGDGMSFLTKPHHFKAKTISIDTYCKEKNITPTIMKIDAEGAEHIILQSMPETIKNAMPIITIEVGGGEEWKENNNTSIDFLLSHGYECYETNLEGKIKLHDRQPVYQYDNLIFVHKTKLDRIKDICA